MIPISGFPGQVPSGQPVRDSQQVSPQEAPAQEPQDAYLPSEGAKGSKSQMAIGDRGAMVREELKEKNFLLRETEHFNLYYIPETDAEREIEDIAGKREQAYQIISDFLEVEATEKISIYIFPSDRDSYCPNWNKTFAGRTIPEARMIGLAYFADACSYEKVNFGHEITHAMEFELITPGKRVPPFIREGIADYLCLSGEDMHFRLSRFIRLSMADSPFVVTGEKLNRAEYMESASFVQFIIGAFGTGAFRDLYRGASILEKGQSLSREQFSDILDTTLGYPLPAIERLWKNACGPYLQAPVQPLPPDGWLSQLMIDMEQATQERSAQKILSLYSDDFYYRSPQQEQELIDTHLACCESYSIQAMNVYDMGTWTYGKTMALKTAGIRKPSAGGEEVPEGRCFLAELIWGKWRLNSRITGGWEC